MENKSNTKYIVVTGGVISGVGKGITAASLGKILEEYGYKVTAMKIDPYVNVDAGTMRPTEHGEVWVTNDGGEIDQDLGNYERFFCDNLSKDHNITTGKVYLSVIEKERRGEFLGKTVQIIPHITDEIKNRVVKCGINQDIVLIEIGGTIGDIENTPFLFALKSLEKDVGRDNILFTLVSYLPVPRHTNEMKTKPTQQSVRMLIESAGIIPEIIFCRAPVPLDEERKKKIETYANIKSDYIISEPDVDTIYKVPLDLLDEKVGLKILELLKLYPKKQPDWTNWKNLVKKIRNSEKTTTIGLIGKYIDTGNFTLEDSYVSVKEALIHAGANLNTKINIKWISAKDLENESNPSLILCECDGILVPGGFGNSGVEGKMIAIKYAREKNIPYLGLCYGMQLALVEFARNKCNIKNAKSGEWTNIDLISETNKNNVIEIIETQKKNISEKRMGGTMRLGGYEALIKENSKVHKLYQELDRIQTDKLELEQLDQFRKSRVDEDKSFNKISVVERHRHRYEVNPKFIEIFEKNGMTFSGKHIRSDNTELMEFIELENNKFFVATQAHPEFKSKLDKPSPLFYGFVKACMK